MPCAVDSWPSLFQDDYNIDDYGLYDSSDWFSTNGLYDTSSASWTPESVPGYIAPAEHQKITAFAPGAPQFSLTAPSPVTHDATSEPRPQQLHWNDRMTSNAHADFFGLDLGVGYAPSCSIPADVFDRAEATLQRWSDVTSSTKTRTVAGVLPSKETQPPSARPDTHRVVTDDDVSLTPGVLPAATISPEPSKKRSPPPSLSSNPAAQDLKINKTFHFVANNDKKTAARIRNTMTSRNLRQSKVSRIAELERELERQQAEAEMWKRRAVEAGWQERGV